METASSSFWMFNSGVWLLWILPSAAFCLHFTFSPKSYAWLHSRSSQGSSLSVDICHHFQQNPLYFSDVHGIPISKTLFSQSHLLTRSIHLRATWSPVCTYWITPSLGCLETAWVLFWVFIHLSCLWLSRWVLIFGKLDTASMSSLHDFRKTV